MASMIGIHDPWIDEEERRETMEALDSNWLSAGGARGAAFNERLSHIWGVPSLATTNGSSALILAMRVAGINSGDHVLVSDYGFIATANAVKMACGEPIFLGASSEDEPVVSLSTVEAFLQEELDSKGCFRKTGRPVRGMLYNEPYGFVSSELREIRKLLNDRGLFLCEDAAQATGVRLGNSFLGSIGDMGIVSFNGNKTISAGTGGALFCQRKEWIQEAKVLATQGRSDPFDFFYQEFGGNYLISELSAAVGLAQLKKLPEILKRKVALRAEYSRLLKGSDWKLAGPREDFPAWMNVVLAPRGLSREEWRELALQLECRGVRVRPVFPPVTRNQSYSQSYRYGELRGDEFFARGLCLPSGAKLGAAEAAKVVGELREHGRKFGFA